MADPAAWMKYNLCKLYYPLFLENRPYSSGVELKRTNLIMYVRFIIDRVAASLRPNEWISKPRSPRRDLGVPGTVLRSFMGTLGH